MGLQKNLGDVGWAGRLFLWCTYTYGMPLACPLARGYPGATLHGRVTPLSQSASVAPSALLEVAVMASVVLVTCGAPALTQLSLSHP